MKKSASSLLLSVSMLLLVAAAVPAIADNPTGQSTTHKQYKDFSALDTNGDHAIDSEEAQGDRFLAADFSRFASKGQMSEQTYNRWIQSRGQAGNNPVNPNMSPVPRNKID